MNDKVTEIQQQIQEGNITLEDVRNSLSTILRQLATLKATRRGRKSQDDVINGELDGFELYYSVIDYLEDAANDMETVIQNESTP